MSPPQRGQRGRSGSGRESPTRASNGARSANEARRVLGVFTATAIVVASMVGTGVFTTTGLLAADLRSSVAILLAWVVGGALAMCGALCYGELAAAMPRNGGEYVLLSRIYHPAAGFLAGWVSMVVGFSAPIAASAVAFGQYLGAVFPAVPTRAAAAALVLVLSVLHATDVRLGSATQNVFTVIKVLLIVVFAAGAFLFGTQAMGSAVSGDVVRPTVHAGPFAVALIFVSFAYSGWNAAVYIAGEVEHPPKTLPRALATGTAVVVALYLLLNVVFLYAVPVEQMAGVVEVGHLAATRLFGEAAGRALSMTIALALVSSVSAMVMSGPRVYQTMGEDYRLFGWLARLRRSGAPARAVGLQALLAVGMIATATFDSLLTYIGFTLSLCTGLTVAGVIVLRRRRPDLPRPYRTWGYPATPLLFLLLTTWMIGHAFWQRPVESLAGLATLAVGGLLYFAGRRTGSSP